MTKQTKTLAILAAAWWCAAGPMPGCGCGTTDRPR